MAYGGSSKNSFKKLGDQKDRMSEGFKLITSWLETYVNYVELSSYWHDVSTYLVNNYAIELYFPINFFLRFKRGERLFIFNGVEKDLSNLI